ncbi:HemK family modification methylase [Mycoplasma ovis str. Michigan]|uniref:HemK family modification methylase n=1 Tax=Mycoplasma ovis str. Michigan TaxID=1415773 RepID=A0ABM5P038_9MOLU|nr:HemK family modification methylase [Mycoplasma ovis str. Michigan]
MLLELGNKISCSAGVDSSFRACQNILENLSNLKIQGNHKVYLSNWDSFLDKNNNWELITINPPYLSSEEWSEKLQYDPKNSLVAKQQGLAHYRKFLDYLKKNEHWKVIILECSEFHEEYWKNIEETNSNWSLKRYRDYLGKFRIVSIVRK